MNLSISDLFIAGTFPGILMQIAAHVVGRRTGWGELIKFEPKRIVRSAARAYLEFGATLVVMYGIYSGAFSPTKAAGVTVLFASMGVVLVAGAQHRADPALIYNSRHGTGTGNSQAQERHSVERPAAALAKTCDFDAR